MYQYEFAYIALQSESYQLSDETTEVIFYSAVKADQPQAVSGPQFDRPSLKEQFQN